MQIAQIVGISLCLNCACWNESGVVKIGGVKTGESVVGHRVPFDISVAEVCICICFSVQRSLQSVFCIFRLHCNVGLISDVLILF